MNPFPFWPLLILALVEVVLIWITDRLARRDERLRTLREADLRARHRSDEDYTRGVMDGTHALLDRLREQGIEVPPSRRRRSTSNQLLPLGVEQI